MNRVSSTEFTTGDLFSGYLSTKARLSLTDCVTLFVPPGIERTGQSMRSFAGECIARMLTRHVARVSTQRVSGQRV